MALEDQIPKIHTEQMEDRRMKVVNTDAIFDSFITHVVGGAMDIAALYASAGHPHTEAAGAVIATGGIALTQL